MVTLDNNCCMLQNACDEVRQKHTTNKQPLTDITNALTQALMALFISKNDQLFNEYG